MLQLSGSMGKGTRLPVPLNDASWLTDESGNLTVQVMIATVGQINKGSASTILASTKATLARSSAWPMSGLTGDAQERPVPG